MNRCHQTSRLNLFISIQLICIKTDGTYNFRLSSHVIYDRKNLLYINTCVTSLVISVFFIVLLVFITRSKRKVRLPTQFNSRLYIALNYGVRKHSRAECMTSVMT